MVYLPSGSVGEIISYLTSLNFNVNKFDKYILVLMGFPQSGWIDVGAGELTKFDFLYKLTTAKAALSDITLIPGETSEIFFKEVAAKLNLNYTRLLAEAKAQAPIPEGFFVPETYRVPMGMNEKHLVYYLVRLSREKHEAVAKKIFGAFDERKWYQYIVVASVVQKEAADESEMPVVASVIYNRLKKGMKLQMDGTLNYGSHSHEVITSARIASDTSRYNTYLHAGLPENAVCNVSFAAITAAIFPKKTDYLYFVRNKTTGKHKFSRTYEAHVSEINKNK